MLRNSPNASDVKLLIPLAVKVVFISFALSGVEHFSIIRGGECYAQSQYP